jgi:hypothetical protein
MKPLRWVCERLVGFAVFLILLGFVIWTMVLAAIVADAQYVQLSGTLQASNGMPAQNYILSFQLSQFGYISGTGVVVNSGTYCATSTDGSVVGVPNPLQSPVVTVAFTGTLPPANYYVKLAFYDASGNLTLPSPERVIQLNSTGQLIVASPVSGLPAGAIGMKVYISATSNTETLQGTTVGSAAFIQSTALVSGANPSSSNTTLCKQIANDAIWPTGTGYTVALTDTGGNTLPGYPMMWQLMGPNTTINLSTGLPYYHGTVYFPTPILASPLNHALQSISGPLSLTGYNLVNAGAIGVGTSLPAWPIDVENGVINASGGFVVNGATPATGKCLGSDGTAYDTPINCFTTGALYYQTVGVAGSPEPQEPELNLIPGANTTVTCADNSGATRTDCTFSSGLASQSLTITPASGASVSCYTGFTCTSLGGVLLITSSSSGGGTFATLHWATPVSNILCQAVQTGYNSVYGYVGVSYSPVATGTSWTIYAAQPLNVGGGALVGYRCAQQ